MAESIKDLKNFVTKNPWLKRLRAETFGVKLPDGWFGRPYDNHHSPKEIAVIGNNLKIVFDGIQEVEIVNPTSFEFQSLGDFSSLTFNTAHEVFFRFTPYGQEKTGRRIERTYRPAENNSLTLIGYFPLDDKNSGSGSGEFK